MIERLIQWFILRRISRGTTTRVAGCTLDVPPSVFHPKYFRSSALLAEVLHSMDLKGKRVLDCGSGTGVLGIVAAKRGGEVTAIDIDADAVETTHRNAERNGVTIRVMQSDWFEQLPGETFDVIACNPPYIRGTGTVPYKHAWFAGDDHEHVIGLVEDVEKHIAPGGVLLLVLSREADVEWWIEELATEGLPGEMLRRGRGVMVFRFTA